MSSNLASLPLVLLGLHSAPKDDQACSSAEAVYGPPLMLPGLFLGLQPSEKFLDRSILQSFSTSPSRVSTKWLNLLRKICAIFAQICFLRTFALFLRMKRNEFCAIFFCAICAKPEIFFAKVAHETKF